jgi:Fur family peroxide stress response transcriptional regulator
VYRNLHVLQELGLARRVETDGQCSRFDADTNEHAHACCCECGCVCDVCMTAPTEFAEEAEKQSGYDIASCTLVFEGLCPTCRCQCQCNAEQPTPGEVKSQCP